ncbi:hypothetical protein GCK32_021959, partial [Trichostrongylus colubriformis]
IRKAGVQFIYVAVGEQINPKHWRYNTTKYDIIAIAGGEENVIYAGEYKELDMSIVKRTVDRICTPIDQLKKNQKH